MATPLRLLALTGALALANTLLAATTSVVASFGIPADWARQTGGASATVSSLTPPNSDFHAVQPTPAQVKAIAGADLVVGIHPELETWLARLEKSGDLRRPVLWLGKPALGEHIGRCCDDPNHRHRGPLPKLSAESDPHLWMDPDLAADAVKRLGAELARLNPGDADAIRARTTAYAGELTALTAEIRQTLATVPPGRRKLVTQHDNLRRFAKKFDLTVVGTLIGGATPETADPSARAIAQNLTLIRKEQVPVIFADNTLAPRLPEAVAREAGLPPPVTLAIDALTAPGTPTDSYTGLMRDTSRKIAAALTPKTAP